MPISNGKGKPMRMSVKRPTVLVLDDDPMVAAILQRVLPDSAIVAAQTPEDFRTRLLRCRPYCVFVDIHLGESGNGLAEVPQIKRRWPHVPVIIMTADTTARVVADALACGADDFVRKPLDRDEVLARLQIRAEQLAARANAKQLRIGDLTWYSDRGSLRVGETTVTLSSLSFRIMDVLLNSHGTIVTKKRLKMAAWSRDTVSDNALDRKLHELRGILKSLNSSVQIFSEYGQGVRIVWRRKSETA